MLSFAIATKRSPAAADQANSPSPIHVIKAGIGKLLWWAVGLTARSRSVRKLACWRRESLVRGTTWVAGAAPTGRSGPRGARARPAGRALRARWAVQEGRVPAATRAAVAAAAVEAAATTLSRPGS